MKEVTFTVDGKELTVPEGTLIIDFVEPNSKNLLWRGAAKGVFDNARTPEKRDKMINEAVQKILQNFPPLKSNSVQ